MITKIDKSKLFLSVLVSLSVSTAIGFNQFFYYLKKVPLIKRLIPDSIYEQKSVKNTLSVFSVIFKFITLIFRKSMYILLLIYLPVYFLMKDIEISQQYAFCMNILFFLSFCLGVFRCNYFVENTSEKYICLNLMRFSPRYYLIGNIIVKQIGDFIGFALVLITMTTLCKRNPLEGILCALLIVAIHTMAEALNLFIYNKKQIDIFSKWWFAAPFIILFLILAYLPLYLKWEFGILKFVYSMPFVLCVLIAGILGFHYIWNYSRYKWLTTETIDVGIFVEQKKVIAGARFSDTQLKDTDYQKSDNRKFELLSGYRYLNTIFFERHKRILYRPLIIRLAIMSAIYLIGIVLFLFDKELSLTIVDGLKNGLSFCVFLMYLLTTNGERVCRAMFKNCDISMLHYGFYREPKVLLFNFRLRLAWMIKPNLIISAALSFMVVSYVKLAGGDWALIDMVLYSLCLFLLGGFFAVHHLFLYYFFQPYTSDLAVKSPFYKGITAIVYSICYLCSQLDSTPGYFSSIVLGATIFYMMAALILIWKYAPKNFRIK